MDPQMKQLFITLLLTQCPSKRDKLLSTEIQPRSDLRVRISSEPIFVTCESKILCFANRKFLITCIRFQFLRSLFCFSKKWYVKRRNIAEIFTKFRMKFNGCHFVVSGPSSLFTLRFSRILTQISLKRKTTGSASDCAVDIARYTLSDLEDTDSDSEWNLSLFTYTFADFLINFIEYCIV